jgi:hypothetical protein
MKLKVVTHPALILAAALAAVSFEFLLLPLLPLVY